MTARKLGRFLAGAAAMLFAIAAFTVAGSRLAIADGRPPLPPNGRELAPGQIPRPCTAGQTSTQGFYFSDRAQQWFPAPFCYGKWGNLDASASQIAAPGSRVTVTAIPTDGSNSGTYAPQTGSIRWTYPGTAVSGSCGPTNLSCTVVPTMSATSEWQWFEFHVSMPRTFFIDSQGDACRPAHLCAGAQTNAWSWVGIAPAGTAGATTAGGLAGDQGWAIGTVGALAAAAAGAAAAGGLLGERSIGDIQQEHTIDDGSSGVKAGGAGGGKTTGPGGGKTGGGKSGDTGRRGPTRPGRGRGRPGKASGR